MKITVEWFDGDKPQFNVSLASGEGKQAFMTVKGCRIIDGTKGQFISWPAKKNEATGKYWNHVYCSEQFNSAVLEEAIKSKPKQDTRTLAERKRPTPLADMDDDIPF